MPAEIRAATERGSNGSRDMGDYENIGKGASGQIEAIHRKIKMASRKRRRFFKICGVFYVRTLCGSIRETRRAVRSAASPCFDFFQ